MKLEKEINMILDYLEMYRYRLDPERVRFEIENNLGDTDPVRWEKQGGIGIRNTRHRLGLLYPGKHHLRIEREKDTFRVFLEIETDA